MENQIESNNTIAFNSHTFKRAMHNYHNPKNGKEKEWKGPAVECNAWAHPQKKAVFMPDEEVGKKEESKEPLKDL